MKKTISAIILSIVAFAVSSCDSKVCKCYIYNGTNTPYTEQEYVSEGESCSSLDYNRGTQYRQCIEANERDIDPHDIGQEYKKK